MLQETLPTLAKLLPPRCHRVITRSRVQAAIDRAMDAGVCWLAAPAGYGKTTAIADYIKTNSLRAAWYRIDEGDGDIASFFHYMGLSLPGKSGAPLPVFEPEYADQPEQFARRFFRTFFARLRAGTTLVFDDMHRAEASQFRAVFAILLEELPDTLRCICISRTLPGVELNEFAFKGRLLIVDQGILRFSAEEARQLIASRVGDEAVTTDISAAHGWAAGLVLLAEHVAAGGLAAEMAGLERIDERAAVFAGLAKRLFDGLPTSEQEALLELSLLPEITAELAKALAGTDEAAELLEGLHRRQLLVSRGDCTRPVFKLHDLLREFLRARLSQSLPHSEYARLRERAAAIINDAGYPLEAIELALEAEAWHLARQLINAQAQTLLAQGRRATLIAWCDRLPSSERDDSWLCYWMGVAHLAEDMSAEQWFTRAWTLFAAEANTQGQCLAAARAVMVKTDSWRTHTGLEVWTRRMFELLSCDLDGLAADDQLLTWSAMLRAIDFAPDYQSGDPVVTSLTQRMLQRLAESLPDDSATARLIASHTLIDHAGSTGKSDVFERAVDSVSADLKAPEASPRVLGVWLVVFGSASGRYFSYAKRGFPYASAEDALRTAIQIGQREELRGVEFGALYHLQLQMKMCGDFGEFRQLIERIATIADSRYTTQVAVVADCQAALFTLQGRLAEAHAACDRFMATIEAANEPPIERWPHFITKFQTLLADRKPREALEFLEDKLPLFDGEVRRRTYICVLAARAFEAKWSGSADYLQRLAECMQQLRASQWFTVMLNLPKLMAELCADALDHEMETDFCRTLISRRALPPPAGSPANWPWTLKIHVLGHFKLEREGVEVSLGAKPPTKSLDIIRALAVAKDHSCALEELYDWLWPDADGDQAKAACEQALHRLRKLLGAADLIVQREGRLRLTPERVGVDLDCWENSLQRALRVANKGVDAEAAMTRVFVQFSGPLLQSERGAHWLTAAAERVRSKYMELVMQLGQLHEKRGDHARARSIYLRALDMYPDSTQCYERLIRGQLARDDVASALEDYQRYERMLRTFGIAPSKTITSLIQSFLSSAPKGNATITPA